MKPLNYLNQKRLNTKKIIIEKQSDVVLLSLQTSSKLAALVSIITTIQHQLFDVHKFANGESLIMPPCSVRSKKVFILHSVSSPVAENFLDLLIAVDACRRASANCITVIMPFFAYSRQDRKTGGREPITAKLMVNLLQTAGVDRFCTVDIHSEQTIGFFEILSDNLQASYESIFHLRNFIYKNYPNQLVSFVSPDFGAVKRTRRYVQLMHDNNIEVAIIDKRRPEPNKAEMLTLFGDVKGKPCFILDDMIDTGGTICEAVSFLKKQGAKNIHIVVSHGILSGNAVERLNKVAEQGDLTSFVVTDTIDNPVYKNIKNCYVISVAPLLAKYLKCVIDHLPLSSLYII